MPLELSSSKFLSDINHACVCLQETKLTSQKQEPQIGYAYHRRDKVSDGRAHGGVARMDIPCARLGLITSLQALFN